MTVHQNGATGNQLTNLYHKESLVDRILKHLQRRWQTMRQRQQKQSIIKYGCLVVNGNENLEVDIDFLLKDTGNSFTTTGCEQESESRTKRLGHQEYIRFT